MNPKILGDIIKFFNFSGLFNRCPLHLQCSIISFFTSIFGLNQPHHRINFDEMQSLSRKGARLSQQQHALD
jgi:hypothetical protein